MNFWGRFKFFFFGILLGTLMVIIIYGERDWLSWTPEGRVLITIKQAEFKMTDHAACEVSCIGIEKDSLISVLTNAEIDFKKSETQKKPCPIYYGENMDLEINYQIEVCERDSLVNLLSIQKKGVECDC